MVNQKLPHIERSIVLLGMMGAGKSSVGQRLAKRLKLPFVDADAEIEKAAQMSIADIFDRHGEAAFRDGERRVIARLLKSPRHVLALGGGAFMDGDTRRLIGACATSIWLDVPLDELVVRVNRNPSKRPLLTGGDIRATLEELMDQRAPVYAEADIRVALQKMPPEDALDTIMAALDKAGCIA